MPVSTPDRSLFACFGVELEYMIVRTADLSVVPWSDRVLVDALGGQPVSDVARGEITWSNELTAHVIELKTTDPVLSFDGLADAFAREVREVNARLAPLGACLLPSAMHPTMRPAEAVLWAHEYSEVYQTFDRIFNCHGHGWSNLQSTHLNLPFADDDEFGRLHAAIRLVLPLLPALAAASPLVEGRLTGVPNNRLAFYRNNSARLPELCGRVIPEPVYTEGDYREAIFEPIRRALLPHDPAGVLLPEFSNSRGAIARFDRQSIEIRVLDIQECPAADLAILRTVIALLRELVAETHLALVEQQAVAVDPLAQLFNECVELADDAWVKDAVVLRAFGADGSIPLRAQALWQQVIRRLDPCISASAAEQTALSTIVEHGTLARRMAAALPARPESKDIVALYRRLAECIQANRPFASRVPW